MWFFRKKRIGIIIVTSGLLLLTLFSIPFFPEYFLERIERKYPSLKIDNGNEKIKDVCYIVVLAGGHVLDPDITLISQFSSPGLSRLIEGIRLYKKIPGTKLILSGGKGIDPIPDSELMAKLAIDLGVAKQDIILESSSLNTYDEARLLKSVLQNERFIMVTSANHMVRSMALFQKMGMNPLPVSTDYLVKRYGENRLFLLIPCTDGLVKSDSLIRESIALLKEKLLGNI
ncbi:MAG: ElyC/SanA/YdcF family protein [Pseudomonadota bacterium]